MHPRIDFVMHEALPARMSVSGRNCQADLPLGTVLTALVCRDYPKRASGEVIAAAEPKIVGEVALRVDASQWYSRSVDVVGSGHTALLTLSGTGFEAVVEALSGAPEDRHYSLCADWRREWKGLSHECIKDWYRLFDAPSGIDVAGACPVCGAAELHRWFDRPRFFEPGRKREGFVGSGGEWTWCSGCGSYEHYSALVPDWWCDPLSVDHALLRHDPDAIESARLRWLADGNEWRNLIPADEGGHSSGVKS